MAQVGLHGRNALPDETGTAQLQFSSGSARSLWKSVKRDRYLYFLAAPGLLLFFVFKYVPMWGLIISFQNYSPFAGVWKSDWVGFDHSVRLFSHPDFGLLLRNTLAISLLNLILFFPLPIVLSLMLNELKNEMYKRFIQTVIYLPHFLSWVIIAGLTFLMFSQAQGVVKLIQWMGGESYDVLTNPDIFWLLLTGQTIWKETGWGTIIFLADIAGTDPQLYEAARMDGAGRIRQMWHVTLPSIRNVIVILLILRLGHIMDVGFEQIYLMYNGAVAEVAEVFDTYVYRNGIQLGQFSFSTAAGLFKSVVGLILVIGANYLAKKFGEEGLY